MFRARLARLVFLCALLVCSVSLLCAQTESGSKSGSDTHPCGTFSDYLIQNSLTASSVYPPAHLPVELMPSRYRELRRVMDGYRLTGMPFVAYDGKGLSLPAPGDDPALYYVVPAVARVSHLGLDGSINLVLIAGVLLGLVVGFAGCLYALQSTPGKVVSCLALLLLTAIACRTGDVYVFEFATTVACVPWAICLIRHKSTMQWKFNVAIFLFGLACGISSLFRLGSAFPALTFLGILLLLGPGTKALSRAVLVITLLIGVAIPHMYLRRVLNRSDMFLQQRVAGHVPGDSRHVFGHFSYVGLGFLSNPYVPGGICDEVAKDKVRSIASNAIYMSSEYDRILRSQVLSMFKQHPAFAAFTIFAKLGVVTGLIVLFANVGLIAAFWYRLPLQMELAFWTAFAVTAAPLILMAPLPLYCLGIISLAVVYGVVGLDHFLATRKPKRSHLVVSDYEDDRIPISVK